MRQLFRELREHDEDQAPPFATVLDAARSRQRTAKPVWLTWRLAATVCPMILVLFSVLLFNFYEVRQNDKFHSAVSSSVPNLSKDVAPIPYLSQGTVDRTEPIVRNRPNHNAKPVRALMSRARQLPARNLHPAMLISEWHSPTDILLKTPGAELFRSIPQVGQPLFEMKNLFPNEKN
jgi:hypothetical protein